ncbi:MAG: nicotinate (nicotinamide) nucleotide adenylyltransferase [Ruminococcus sp.]|nr:nicotinate (nicotinamide) nucleotide adenylyltransferase [Ruminococcus sp.]
MRIGIYGGSFNPVHNGHIHLAGTAIEELGLDRLYLIPSRISPHRSTAEYVAPEDRLEMLRLACKGSRYRKILRVSDYELRSDRVSYTIYTVEEFRRRFPKEELVLLIGSDMLLSFDKWHRYEDILHEVTLAAFSREEGDLEELRKKAEELGKYGKVLISRAEPVVVSSTEIRKKIAKNENYSCYLDKNVVQYIRSGNLYADKNAEGEAEG